MYITRTAGIETSLNMGPRAIPKRCILPALRELKHGKIIIETCIFNVSYPHCGNFRFLFTNKKHVIRWYASARMACFLFFLFYFVGI